MTQFVYLAGPIMGCNKSEANDWREYVDSKLIMHGITAISPLRCEPLVGERYNVEYTDPRFGTARAIANKNMFDVQNCALTLAYMPKPEPGRRQSWGTMCELAWARAMDKRTILVSDDPDVLEHPVLDSCTGWKLSTLDEAIDTVIGVLGGYNGGKNV